MAKVRGGGVSKRVEVGVRAGKPQTNVISRDAVMHLGNQRGTHVTEQGDLKRPKVPLVERTAPQVPSGNAVATSTVCGVGGSRTVYRTGSQSQHGKVNPGSTPAHRELHGEYGPEVSTPGTTLKR